MAKGSTGTDLFTRDSLREGNRILPPALGRNPARDSNARTEAPPTPRPSVQGEGGNLVRGVRLLVGVGRGEGGELVAARLDALEQRELRDVDAEAAGPVELRNEAQVRDRGLVADEELPG